MSKRPFISTLANRFHPVLWWGLAIAFVVLFQFTQRWLDGLYTASQFPVPYYVAQTAFDAQKLKGWYAVLIQQGTFDLYIGVQIADYAYMATVLAGFFTTMVAIYHSLPARHWLKGAALIMTFIAPMAPVFDALENLVSFVMLSQPQSFADWLVYPYSAFACAKFAIYVLTYLWAPFAIVIALLSRIWAMIRPASDHALPS